MLRLDRFILAAIGKEQMTLNLLYQEWLLSALGAFRQNLMVSTLYTNLGDDAICHGIQETEVCV